MDRAQPSRNLSRAILLACLPVLLVPAQAITSPNTPLHGQAMLLAASNAPEQATSRERGTREPRERESRRPTRQTPRDNRVADQGGEQEAPLHLEQQRQREPRFSREEQQQIERWYRERNLQPTAAINPSQGGLPPGLQRRLQRGGELPPGWQRKVEPGMTLSQEQVRHARRPARELLDWLPEQPEGTVLMESDDQVVRVIEATGEVLDVLGIGRRR